MIVITDANVRSLRGAAASSEGRQKVTQLLTSHRQYLEEKRTVVAEVEKLLDEKREELAQIERNVSLIEGVLSEVQA